MYGIRQLKSTARENSKISEARGVSMGIKESSALKMGIQADFREGRTQRERRKEEVHLGEGASSNDEVGTRDQRCSIIFLLT